MSKEVIKSDAAPLPIGPYSQAIRAGGLLFLAGQIPLDPATGQIAAGDIKAQTRCVLQNLAAVLEAAGSSVDRVVKTTVFLKDMNDFGAMGGGLGIGGPHAAHHLAAGEIGGLVRGNRAGHSEDDVLGLAHGRVIAVLRFACCVKC